MEPEAERGGAALDKFETAIRDARPKRGEIWDLSALALYAEAVGRALELAGSDFEHIFPPSPDISLETVVIERIFDLREVWNQVSMDRQKYKASALMRLCDDSEFNRRVVSGRSRSLSESVDHLLKSLQITLDAHTASKALSPSDRNTARSDLVDQFVIAAREWSAMSGDLRSLEGSVSDVEDDTA